MNYVDPIEDLLKYYKNIGKCKRCGLIYGFNTSYDNGICPRCEIKESNAKKKVTWDKKRRKMKVKNV